MIRLYDTYIGAIDTMNCHNIIARSLLVDPSDAKVGYHSESDVNLDHRRSTIRWLSPNGIHRDIHDTIMEYVRLSNRDNFGFDLWGISELQFTEYHGTQDGHFGWHHDVDFLNQSPFDRKLSVVIQLSDPSSYQGGLFDFFNLPNPTGFEIQGSLMVFPSFYPHRVLPVISGTRYSLVAWVEGPKFR